MPRKRELDPIVFQKLQREIALYFEQEFPERHKAYRRHIPIYKCLEAIGEIMGSLYTERTDRRHDPEIEREIQKAGIARLIIYAIEFANRHGYDTQHLVRQGFEFMHGEDWERYENVGRPPKEEVSLADDS